ncbi:MAG: transposase [Chloroflexota bacterium]|nr:transposase [Chloroflexota bacterium]
MVGQEAVLVTLVKLVDRIPEPPAPPKRGRGHPKTYSHRLIVKALVIMVIRRLYPAYSLLAFLAEETELTQALRPLLYEQGRFPTRRTWERRLAAVPDPLPALIGCWGAYLVALLQPWGDDGRAVAVDSTPLRAHGGVWHKKDREAGLVPHSSIDTEAHWSKSGYHGWWYGWKLLIVCPATRVWIPLAAALTPANEADNEVAPRLLHHLPAEVRYVLGDTHYNDPQLRTLCEQAQRWLITTRRGKYPHGDGGAPVRKLFHQLRSTAIEPFNGLFKNIFEWRNQVPVRGLRRTQLIVLGALLVYQLVLLYQFDSGRPLGVGIKALLRAA